MGRGRGTQGRAQETSETTDKETVIPDEPLGHAVTKAWGKSLHLLEPRFCHPQNERDDACVLL